MKTRHIYQAAGVIALCGVIWILGQVAYRGYEEIQLEPVIVGIPPSAVLDPLPPVEELTVALPALEDLTAAVERPIFWQSRRPFEAAIASEEAVFESGTEFDLVGIVIWQGRRIALIRSNADASIVRVELGGKVAGWVAVGIEAESVLLRNGETEREMHLKYTKEDSSG